MTLYTIWIDMEDKKDVLLVEDASFDHACEATKWAQENGYAIVRQYSYDSNYFPIPNFVETIQV